MNIVCVQARSGDGAELLAKSSGRFGGDQQSHVVCGGCSLGLWEALSVTAHPTCCSQAVCLSSGPDHSTGQAVAGSLAHAGGCSTNSRPAEQIPHPHFTDGEKTENPQDGNGSWLGLLFSHLFFHESCRDMLCKQLVSQARLSESRAARGLLESQGPCCPDGRDRWRSVYHSPGSSGGVPFHGMFSEDTHVLCVRCPM